MIHGGDIYRNQVELDFSVNINPLGMSAGVRKALTEAVDECMCYPDPWAEQLKRAVAGMLSVREESLLLGNGASELFLAVVCGLRPQRTVIPVPSFYGYEYAAAAGSGEICYYPLKQENHFGVEEGLLSCLDEETDLLFLANPNNPVGNLIPSYLLEKILCHCREKGICVVLDECFIEFCREVPSMVSRIEEYDNLILIRSFTKTFAIPGVRLGYLVCSNRKLLSSIKRQLPEWNLSVFAQRAGTACVREYAMLEEMRKTVQREREFLERGLKEAGFLVFPAEADFILIHTQIPLGKRLCEKGILIRDCSNFRGLSEGYFRIAVKTREENLKLLQAIGELI